MSGGLRLQAQEGPGRDPADEPRGFRKDLLFTGGSLALGFSSNSFQAGANPFFGYSLSSWVDLGIVINYHYTSYRQVYTLNDKLRRSNYGGGLFTRIYPIDFLFVQGQYEYNFIREKYIPGGMQAEQTMNLRAPSLLVGAGYASGRMPQGGRPFFYLSVLFDVLNDPHSPYGSAAGNIVPIIRGGLQVPLFQGGSGRPRW